MDNHPLVYYHWYSNTDTLSIKYTIKQTKQIGNKLKFFQGGDNVKTSAFSFVENYLKFQLTYLNQTHNFSLTANRICYILSNANFARPHYIQVQCNMPL